MAAVQQSGWPAVISLIEQHLLLDIRSRQRHAGAVAEWMNEREAGEAVEHVVAGDAGQQARRFTTESTESITISRSLCWAVSVVSAFSGFKTQRGTDFRPHPSA